MDDNSTNEWNRIRSVFEDVLMRPADEQRRYAVEVCGSDGHLLNEVLSLLASHESSRSFLESPAVLQFYEVEQQPN